MSTNARENRIFWDDRQSQYGAAEITYLWSVPSSFRCDRTSHNRAHSHMLDILNFFLCSVINAAQCFKTKDPPNAAIPSHHGCPHAPSLAGGPGTLRDAHSRGLPPAKEGLQGGGGAGTPASFPFLPSPTPTARREHIPSLKEERGLLTCPDWP